MKLKLQNTNDECSGGPSRPVRRRVPAPFVIRGFTLLELLLAILVFAVVLSALHVVFFTAFRLRNKTTENIERGLPLQQTLAIIKRDLANLAPPGGPLSGSLQSTPTSTGSGNMALSSSLNGQSGPQFYTAVGIVDDNAPWGEIERVSYTLSQATDRTPGMDLHRMVTRNLLPAAQADVNDQFLMSGVESLAFQYYDGNAWRDTWDSTQPDTTTGLTNNLPHAIKMQLRLYNDNRSMGAMEPVELIVPLMVQARTNVTTEAEGGAQ